MIFAEIKGARSARYGKVIIIWIILLDCQTCIDPSQASMGIIRKKHMFKWGIKDETLRLCIRYFN